MPNFPHYGLRIRGERDSRGQLPHQLLNRRRGDHARFSDLLPRDRQATLLGDQRDRPRRDRRRHRIAGDREFVRPSQHLSDFVHVDPVDVQSRAESAHEVLGRDGRRGPRDRRRVSHDLAERPTRSCQSHGSHVEHLRDLLAASRHPVVQTRDVDAGRDRRLSVLTPRDSVLREALVERLRLFQEARGQPVLRGVHRQTVEDPHENPVLVGHRGPRLVLLDGLSRRGDRVRSRSRPRRAIMPLRRATSRRRRDHAAEVLAEQDVRGRATSRGVVLPRVLSAVVRAEESPFGPIIDLTIDEREALPTYDVSLALLERRGTAGRRVDRRRTYRILLCRIELAQSGPHRAVDVDLWHGNGLVARSISLPVFRIVHGCPSL